MAGKELKMRTLGRWLGYYLLIDDRAMILWVLILALIIILVFGRR